MIRNGNDRSYLRLIAIILVVISVTPILALAVPEAEMSLEELIALPEEKLAKIDIALLNLAAAEGLPGSEHVDREAVRRTLDAWAHSVALLTFRHAHTFPTEPEIYGTSWAKFCAYHLLRTLQLGYGVHYNHEQRTNPSLAKSQDQFIHGIVQGTGGTCASLPVLYIAVGRRLGYPLKLAQSMTHYYVRWDDPKTGEQFAIDGSGDGYGFHDDDFYKSWPRPLSPEQLEQGNYLRSLSPREELSTFLTTRADSLRESGLLSEAVQTYRNAVELAPRNLFAAGLLQETTAQLARKQRGESEPQGIWYSPHDSVRKTREISPGIPELPQVTMRRPPPGPVSNDVKLRQALQFNAGPQIQMAPWAMQAPYNETPWERAPRVGVIDDRYDPMKRGYGMPPPIVHPRASDMFPTAPRPEEMLPPEVRPFMRKHPLDPGVRP